ncbi:Phosphate starvation-inducible protein PsiF [Pseudomonas fluorescens]|uniref:Phosphate starvation-inducible protein PsiF n=1 Tax=Pseudomonas fluorescens TaxID=294 RepID=A0A5E7TDJ7_PSEFL|nr:PsiF family protein [Pseudomonas fluorescens]VVP95827.1 Phosphate starvation-inducible protein PsiF [Pseudomonas fluorescens]
MKMLRVPLLMIGLLLCAQGFAATAQQNKMTTCNADPMAKTLKGEERAAFMKKCLSATPAANEDGKVLTPQQKKMQTCNADAKTKALTGEARQAFVNDCLRKK